MPLPSEPASGLTFVCGNVVGVFGGGREQLLFLAEKRKPASCGFEENRNGAPDRIRTYGFLLRRQTLYPLSYWGTS